RLRGSVAVEIFLDSLEAVIRDVLRPVAAGRHGTPVGSAEEPAVPVVLLDRETALVQRGVVCRAKEDKVSQARLPAVRPMLDVMRFDEARAAAARESAAAVAGPQGPVDRRRHDSRLAPDAERLA